MLKYFWLIGKREISKQNILEGIPLHIPLNQSETPFQQSHLWEIILASAAMMVPHKIPIDSIREAVVISRWDKMFN